MYNTEKLHILTKPIVIHTIILQKFTLSLRINSLN